MDHWPALPFRRATEQAEPSIVSAAGAEQLASIAELAGRIWRAYYPAIITPAQIEYMLARMYSSETLLREVRSQAVHFYQLLLGGKLAGFASIGPTDTADTFKLHKLYLLPEAHGVGLGRCLLHHCEMEASKHGATRLLLAVNKRNAKAIAFYLRNGFVIIESSANDIGGGFIMDDFIMAKELQNEMIPVSEMGLSQ